MPPTARRYRTAVGPKTIALFGAIASLALLVGGLVAPAFATQSEGESWSVSTVDGEQGENRSSFSYELEPGATVEDAIQVRNTGTEQLSLNIYAADAFTTSDGAVDILPADQPSVDAGMWIVPTTESIDLAPGESTTVNFTITIPNSATPGDHSAALVASLLEADTGSQVQVERRLGLRVTIRVPGDLTANVTLDAVETNYSATWNPFSPGRVNVTYSLTNTGNTRINVVDDVRLSGLFGWFPSATFGTEATDLLPGSTVNVTREVPTGVIGPVSGELTIVNTPNDESVAAPESPLTQEVSAVATPWMLILLLVIVLAAIIVVIVIWIRRRRMAQWIAYARRKQEEEESEEPDDVSLLDSADDTATHAEADSEFTGAGTTPRAEDQDRNH
ncbi:MAG: WxL protein peptidoglycan domain-containing protein [Gulosibacter sp.]|uniref:WxL protein peptidoglycan domain-containing protein n=1 Tax=Gulosibacter sp. TaxID=2817531 RepID=UPI003F92D624